MELEFGKYFDFGFRRNKEFKNSFGDRMVNTCSVT